MKPNRQVAAQIDDRSPPSGLSLDLPVVPPRGMRPPVDGRGLRLRPRRIERDDLAVS